MLCSGGGCDSTIAARCYVVWAKFRKLLSVLTNQHLSHRIYSKVYEACVCVSVLHRSNTWGPNNPELQRFCINDRAWSTTSLLQKLGIGDITLVLHCWPLRWYGHVQWAMSCIKSITNFSIPSTNTQERPQRTWSECVKTDVSKWGLAGIDPHDIYKHPCSTQHGVANATEWEPINPLV